MTSKPHLPQNKLIAQVVFSNEYTSNLLQVISKLSSGCTPVRHCLATTAWKLEPFTRSGLSANLKV